MIGILFWKVNIRYYQIKSDREEEYYGKDDRKAQGIGICPQQGDGLYPDCHSDIDEGFTIHCCEYDQGVSIPIADKQFATRAAGSQNDY